VLLVLSSSCLFCEEEEVEVGVEYRPRLLEEDEEDVDDEDTEDTEEERI